MNEQHYEVAEVYSDLRSQVLQLAARDSTGAPVLAVLMETGYTEAVATLVAVSDGTVSLYFSSGGGVIGAGEHEAVREVAGRFLPQAESFVPKAAPTESFSLPGESRVRFYIVTPDGTFTAEALEQDLGYNRHPFSPLFHQGHELITTIREHSE